MFVRNPKLDNIGIHNILLYSSRKKIVKIDPIFIGRKKIKITLLDRYMIIYHRITGDHVCSIMEINIISPCSGNTKIIVKSRHTDS